MAEPAKFRVAYILLWFPLASETFIFREILQLSRHGLDIIIYTMYGKSMRGWSQKMKDYTGPVKRMGVKSIFAILLAFMTALFEQPRLVLTLMKRGLFRRMRNFEALCENTWCFFAGFLLAKQCKADGINLIHSAWANGPATAAWVASWLTGIPFAFTGRAGDIYPQDGILAEKANDAVFIRTNNAANVNWLASFCPPDQSQKVFLVYNGLTFVDRKCPDRSSACPPYHILAIGRFARTKGFPELFTAMARLARENFPVELTIIGDGSWRHRLVGMRKRLGLEKIIHMPGFVPNDQLAHYMESHDLLVVPSVVHSNGDRDGIPNVIMEALSVGLPVVATDVCGISEVIQNHKTGALVPQRNPEELALAIRYMLTHGKEALAMAQAGCALVSEMFDPKKNSHALYQLYREVLKGSSHA